MIEANPSHDPIHPSENDAADWEYELAGLLLRSDWVFPDGDVRRIKSARHARTTEQGYTYKFVEVVDGGGTRHSVEGFKRRIDLNDLGDLEPANGVAERVQEWISGRRPSSQ